MFSMAEEVPENDANFVHSSRAFALLGEVLVKLGQNAPNLLCRNVRLIQFEINRHKNDVCRRLEVIDQAIARTFAFPDIAVPYSHFEYSMAGPWHLIAYDLASQKLIDRRLNVRTDVPVLLGKRSQVALKFMGKLNLHRFGWLIRHRCHPTIQIPVVFRLPLLPSTPGGSYHRQALTPHSHGTIGQSGVGSVDIRVASLRFHELAVFRRQKFQRT
jgi:hypothetical protein